MSRLFWALLLAVCAIYVSPLNACVGKTLHIGIIDTPNEQLLAELTSQLITARTGTTVKVEKFKGQKELYNSVKKGQVAMVIENTDRAMEMIGKPHGATGKAALETAKSEYRKSLNMIWLEPYGQVQGNSQQLLAPVISSEILSSLPALPKLLQKLSGITNDSAYGKMLKTKGDDGSKKVARDFLKSRKLI
ncbi:MAG TPA: glycine betaine ABC transporter substrate-binding protein [Geobacteraceae bacterium]|nr:glycine betaine ABC transporter substrate-binding protein [Geobacteraceae bacterium]